jgi:3-oxoacyl-[acyl-carrier protein] reductase
VSGLEGRVALITGAAGGIGLATARLLAAQGCQIAAADLGAADDAYAADWLALNADVAEPGAGDRVVAEVLHQCGRLDVFVACAGVYETLPLEELTVEELDRVLAVNVRGALFGARAALRPMGAAGWGRIVLLGSIVAHNGGGAAGAAYVASKAAVLGVARALAREAGPAGVTVNCVSPGVIATPMTARLGRATKDEMASRTPLRRLGSPEEVAFAIASLCAEGASFITGADLDVNGGLAMV